jgi:hypothetical protein
MISDANIFLFTVPPGLRTAPITRTMERNG